MSTVDDGLDALSFDDKLKLYYGEDFVFTKLHFLPVAST
jgi:hypothetical protein